MPNLASLASVLDDVAQRLGLGGKLLEHRLQRRWSLIVGDQVAAHTRPESIRFKRLHVIVDSSVWVQQLMFLKPALLEKIHTIASPSLIGDMVFRVGEVDVQVNAKSTDRSAESVAEDKRPLSPEERAAVVHHAEAVRDPELRSQLEEVMARALTSSRRTLPL